MRRLSILLALALILVAAAAAIPAAASADPVYFGFNDNAVLTGQATAATDASLAAQAGANVHRMMFDWRWAESSQGNWQLATYDAAYQADLARGIRPMFILMFAPQWTWAAGTPCVQWTQDCRYPPGPTHLDAWRNVVTKLVTRYPKMAGLEIWNEPNMTGFWQGGPDPAYYTTLLSQAYDTVHGLGSTIPVVSAGLAPVTSPSTASTMNAREYLQAMYAAGAKGEMDGIGLHPYPGDIDLELFFKSLTEARDVRDANGDSVPLWITEAGVSTTGTANSSYAFNENSQAVMLQQLYTELSGMSDVRAIIFHTLLEPTTVPATDTERGFGIIHPDLTLKPAYCALAALRGSGFDCPSTVAAVYNMPVQRLRWTAEDYAQAAADAARTWYGSHGTYYGLSPKNLHKLDLSLSATGADATLQPGSSADPSRVSVWVWGTQGSENLLLCNTSQADRSYCVQTQVGNPWKYGSALGNVNAAAGSTTSVTYSNW